MALEPKEISKFGELKTVEIQETEKGKAYICAVALLGFLVPGENVNKGHPYEKLQTLKNKSTIKEFPFALSQ